MTAQDVIAQLRERVLIDIDLRQRVLDSLGVLDDCQKRLSSLGFPPRLELRFDDTQLHLDVDLPGYALLPDLVIFDDEDADLAEDANFDIDPETGDLIFDSDLPDDGLIEALTDFVPDGPALEIPAGQPAEVAIVATDATEPAAILPAEDGVATGEGPEADMGHTENPPQPSVAVAGATDTLSPDEGEGDPPPVPPVADVVVADVAPAPVAVPTAPPPVARAPVAPLAAANASGQMWTDQEDDLAVRMAVEGKPVSAIAAALGRPVPGTQFRLNKRLHARIKEGRDAVPPADPSVAARLEALGNTKCWTRKRDLDLARLKLAGKNLRYIAIELKLDEDDVEARWQQLCPNRSLIGATAAVVAALERRV